MGGSGGALLSAGPLHCQSLPRRAHVARLHGSARKGHLQGMQHRSRRGYGLEEVPQSSADGQPLLGSSGVWCCSAARAGCRSTPTATPTRPPTWRSTPASRSWSTAICSITAARRVSPISRSCSSIMLFQFITAACGMAAMAGIMKALAAKNTKAIGNFWVYLVKSTTRILMPLSLLVGILLVINGTPMSFDGKQTITTLEGRSRSSRRAPRPPSCRSNSWVPTAAVISASTLRIRSKIPTPSRTCLECWSILIIPMAMVLGFRLLRPSPQAGRLDLRCDALRLHGRYFRLRSAGDGRQPQYRRNGHRTGPGLDGGQGNPHRFGRFGHVGHGDDRHLERLGELDARFADPAERYDADAQHADQLLVRRCRRGLDELLRLPHHRRLHQRTDGGPHARIPRT